MASSWFLRQGSLHTISHNGFWKSDHDFLIPFHSNFLSVMHGFQDNEVLLQAGYDVIVISPLGAPQAILHDGFWKGDQDFIFMFNWHFLSTLNCLDVIQLNLAGISLLGGENLGVFGQNGPQNVKLEKNICWEGTSLRQTASIEPLCVKLSLSVWPVQVRKKNKKAVRKAGRKKSQEVYISRMCGATPSRRISTKFSTCSSHGRYQTCEVSSL